MSFRYAGRWLVAALLLVPTVAVGAGLSAPGAAREIAAPANTHPAHPVASATPGWLPFTAPQSFSVGEMASGTDGHVYVLGIGIESYHLYEVYGYPFAGHWAQFAHMPTSAMDFGVTAGTDGRLYVMGGFENPYSYSTVQVLDPVADTWSLGASMPAPRSGMAAVTGPDGRIYSIGGFVGRTGETDVLIYSPTSGAWTTGASAPGPILRHGATLGPDGRIYAVTSATYQYATALYAYTPTSDTWTTVATPPSDAGIYLLTGADGRIYALPMTSPGATVYAYSPTSDSWSPVTPLPSGSSSGVVGAAYGIDGRLYVLMASSGSPIVGYAYGPVLTARQQYGSVRATVTLTGKNFAGNATVKIYWSNGVTTTQVATGKTTATGAFTSPIRFHVPVGAKLGAYTVTAVDMISHYPAVTMFTVVQ